MLKDSDSSCTIVALALALNFHYGQTATFDFRYFFLSIPGSQKSLGYFEEGITLNM